MSRILFVARHPTYFRNFDGVIRALASSGHTVHLASERGETLGGADLVAALTDEFAGVTAGEAPQRDDDVADLVTRLRLAIDYVRYLDPMYDGTPRLRTRAAERAPEFIVRFGASGWARRRFARGLVRRALRSAEDALPSSPRIGAFLQSIRPDVMLVTPLLGVIESPQPDYVRAARRLGIPTALCVWSWDHLSSKALIRDMPDRVFVWNDTQRDEAVRFHGVPLERVVVTGAQCFDQWFGRTPSRTREELCRDAGLPHDRPFLLYVGSALFRGSPSEAAFAERWRVAVRTLGDARLREVGILFRPHPQRAKEWSAFDLSADANAVCWGGHPVTDQARNDYFDALHYGAAVVGLNTSAFLEAAIAGRPVFVPLPPEFRDNQEGTIHFHYLTTAGGGLLRVSRTLEEHVAQLGAALANPPDPALNESFLRAFIRPRGLDVPATRLFADEVERLANTRAAAVLLRGSASGRAMLAILRAVSESESGRAWLMNDGERAALAYRNAKLEARAAQQRAKLMELERKHADKQERQRRKRESIEGWRRRKREQARV